MTALKFGRRNKYGAKRADGFASQLERAVWIVLINRQALGEIKDIKRQQTVRLSRADITYKADFSFTEIQTGETVWAEAKGVELETWRLKKKLWKCYGPGRLEIYKGHHKRPILSEVLEPKQAALTCPGCGVEVAPK